MTDLQRAARVGVWFTLAAIALVFLFAGCVRTREVQIPVKVPLLVIPRCEVPNVFEKCKAKCMESGQRPTDAWESETKFECNCTPFDAYLMPPPWRVPGPRKAPRACA